MSYADEYTEAEIKRLGGKIAREYKSIQKDIQRDAEEYFARFADEQAKKLAKVKVGEISKAEYEQWARNKMLYGKRYEDLESRVVDRLVNANNVSANYINGTAKDVFALNNRFQQFKMEQGTGISLSMYDDNTINRLITKNPKLLPRAKVNIPKNEQWNQKKMRKTLVSGIVRGLSVKELSSDLGAVTTMNKNSALRNARTMVTGAQNSGRLESMLRFKGETGIDIKKEWMATSDARTRDSHAHLNGEQVPVEEEFSNGCMCPGDPNGKPEEVYNCRCTMRMIMPDVIERKDKNEDDTLQEFTFHVGMNVRYGGQKIGYKPILLTQSKTAKEKADYKGWAKIKMSQPPKIMAIAPHLQGNFEDFRELQIDSDNREVLKQLSGNSQRTGNEWCAVYDGVTYSKAIEGTENAVAIPPMDENKKYKILHSHTSNSLFSHEDMVKLCRNDVDEIQLTTLNGDAYVCSSKNGIKPTEKEFFEAYKEIDADVAQMISEDISVGVLKPIESSHAHVRELNIRLSRYFEWDLQGGKL